MKHECQVCGSPIPDEDDSMDVFGGLILIFAIGGVCAFAGFIFGVIDRFF